MFTSRVWNRYRVKHLNNTTLLSKCFYFNVVQYFSFLGLAVLVLSGVIVKLLQQVYILCA